MNSIILRLIILLALSNASLASDAEHFSLCLDPDVKDSKNILFFSDMSLASAPLCNYSIIKQIEMYHCALTSEIGGIERELIKLLPKIEPFCLFLKKYKYLGYICCSDINVTTYFLREIKTNEIIAVENNNPSDKLLFKLAELFEARFALKNTVRYVDRSNFTSNPLGIIPKNLCGSQKQEDYHLVKQQIIDILCSHFLNRLTRQQTIDIIRSLLTIDDVD